MSGKGNISLKRTDTVDSKLLTQGVKSLVFCHSANAGETGISFSGLNWSAQDQIDSGITNPSAGEILSSNLFFYKSNIEVLSTARGILAPISYKVTNSALIWNGFTALQYEKFFISVRNVVRTSNAFADAQPLFRQGVIAEGYTEFDFISQVKIPTDIAYQPITVYIDGEIVSPNTGNSSVTTDGMYYLKDLGNGFSRSIKLNSAAPVGGHQITIVGTLVYAPDNSLLSQIESLNSKMDIVIPDLALVAGNSESKYRAAPANVDLSYFASLMNKVLDVQIQTSTLESWSLIQAGNAFLNGNAEVEFNLATANIKKNNITDSFTSTSNLLYAVDDSANTRTKFFASKPLRVVIAWSPYAVAAGDTPRIYFNGSTINQGAGANSATGNGYGATPSTIYLNGTTDYFSVGYTGTISSGDLNYLTIFAEASETKTIRTLIGA